MEEITRLEVFNIIFNTKFDTFDTNADEIILESNKNKTIIRKNDFIAKIKDFILSYGHKKFENDKNKKEGRLKIIYNNKGTKSTYSLNSQEIELSSFSLDSEFVSLFDLLKKMIEFPIISE